jgi:hypothetical protein
MKGVLAAATATSKFARPSSCGQVRAAKFMRPSRSGHVFSPEHLRAVRFGLNLAIKGACARPLRISFPKVMAPLFPPAAARAKRNEKK